MFDKQGRSRVSQNEAIDHPRKGRNMKRTLLFLSVSLLATHLGHAEALKAIKKPEGTAATQPAGTTEVQIEVPYDFGWGARVFGPKAPAYRIEYSGSRSRTKSLRLRVRPGYSIAYRWTFHVYLDGKEVPGRTGGKGVPDSWEQFPREQFLPPEIVARVLSGQRLSVMGDVEVLETARPAEQPANLREGEYRLLWKGQIEGTFDPRPRNSEMEEGKKLQALIAKGHKLARDLHGSGGPRPDEATVRATVASLVPLLADHRGVLYDINWRFRNPYRSILVDYAACGTLAQIGVPALPAVMEAAKGHSDGPARALAVSTVAQIQELATKRGSNLAERHVTLAEFFRTMAGDTDWHVRRAAIAALPLSAATQDVALAAAALDDLTGGVREAAARALGQMGAKGQAAALVKQAGDDAEISVRVAAMRALGEMKAPEAVDPLIGALNDRDRMIRTTAATALGQIGNRKAVEPLLASLAQNDYDTPRAAIEALGALKDRRAIEPLIPFLDDKNLNLTAWRALQAITGQPLGPDKTAWLQWWKKQPR